jgi:hypothetical protein
MVASELHESFDRAVRELTAQVEAARINVQDEDTSAETRRWLNGPESSLDWAASEITPDEWFFITTLYGTMTLEGQRTHIRKFFPLFVQQCGRDVRNFRAELLANWKLRSPWMKIRLCRMGEILRQNKLNMADYLTKLREIESQSTPQDPMPALDRIMRDHRAAEGKTLGVFIRDCVRGNCFPIDSRVAKQLGAYALPSEERQLVSLCLSMGLNPRKVARVFYQAGGIAP